MSEPLLSRGDPDGPLVSSVPAQHEVTSPTPPPTVSTEVAPIADAIAAEKVSEKTIGEEADVDLVGTAPLSMLASYVSSRRSSSGISLSNRSSATADKPAVVGVVEVVEVVVSAHYESKLMCAHSELAQ